MGGSGGEEVRVKLKSSPTPPPPPQLSLPPYLNNKINQGVRTGFAGLAKIVGMAVCRKTSQNGVRLGVH